MLGVRHAEQGEGNRVGRHGDFIGVREYQRGDCMKQVNWIATARADKLIVTQRSGPQCPSLLVVVDVSATGSRDAIADRIRVAASLLANLHQASIPIRVQVGNRDLIPRRGHEGFVQLMDLLVDVPLDGVASQRSPEPPRHTASITVSSNEDGHPLVTTIDPSVNQRLSGENQQKVCDRGDLANQLKSFWTEVRDANLVA